MLQRIGKGVLFSINTVPNCPCFWEEEKSEAELRKENKNPFCAGNVVSLDENAGPEGYGALSSYISIYSFNLEWYVVELMYICGGVFWGEGRIRLSRWGDTIQIGWGWSCARNGVSVWAIIDKRDQSLKFMSNWARARVVGRSSLRTLLKVASRSGSGRHCLSASLARVLSESRR